MRIAQSDLLSGLCLGRFLARTRALGWARLAVCLLALGLHRGPILAADKPRKVRDDEALANVHRLHERVFSGAEPHGEAGFAALRELGVKTIISVDGAKPDVEAAKRHGLRYVHLPHGYDGVPEGRVRELAKAVRELDGPIYIHCHHGKHRSPAAAAVACVAAGLVPPVAAEQILETAGTSKAYRGLYQSARDARPLDAQSLAALHVEFQEVSPLPALADAMVEIDRHHDHLKQIGDNRWRPLPKHPDLSPAHEALLLREQFSELLRGDDVRRANADHQKSFHAAQREAQDLEAALKGWTGAAPAAESVKRLDSALATVTARCADCHRRYRDVPLGEKRRK